jgi:hypothetical protein
MKPPKCRLCAADHWGYEPHKFKDAAPNTAPNKIPAPNKVAESEVVEGAVVPSCSGVDPKVARSSKWKKANPDLYRAYQRELMRKRRAKAG